MANLWFAANGSLVVASHLNPGISGAPALCLITFSVILFGGILVVCMQCHCGVCPCGDHVVFKSRSVFQCSVSVLVEVAVSRLAFHCLSLGLLTLCSYLSSHVDCPDYSPTHKLE